jgi:tetratricopeptide (TPR) repeat protein
MHDAGSLKAVAPGEEIGERIARLLDCYREGDQRGVGAWFSRSFEPVLVSKDQRSEVFLCRCAVLVFGPPVAREWLTRGRTLAKNYNLGAEEAQLLANLGLVHLELGELARASECLNKSLHSLEGSARAVVLNNLALVVAQSDRPKALRLLASALCRAARRHAAAILSNQMVLETEGAPLRPPDFEPLAKTAAEDCAVPLFDLVRWNHVRALLEAGRPESALDEAKARRPQESEFRDGPLGLGRWANLHQEILRALNRSVPARLAAQAAALTQSAEPHAWLYRRPWALASIPLDTPPGGQGAE